MDKIKVEAKFGYSPDVFIVDENVKPEFFIISLKRNGKDGFESTIKIPMGDVSSEEFAKAVKVLHLAAQSFYHQIYTRLREQMEEERENFPPLLGKDQRGS